MAGDKTEKPKVGLYEAAGGLLLTCAMYAIARLLSKTIPAIGSISFHLYVYLILMTAVLNVLNVIPVKLKVGVKQCSDFLTKPLMCYGMVGIGIAFTDLGELAAALTWQTLVISAAVVAGAAIGAGFVGYAVRLQLCGVPACVWRTAAAWATCRCSVRASVCS